MSGNLSDMQNSLHKLPGQGEPTNCFGKDSQNTFYKLLSGLFVKTGGLVVGKSSRLRQKKIPKCMPHVRWMMLFVNLIL